jgi:hypothetical protein
MTRWAVLLATVGVVLMTAQPGLALNESAAWGTLPTPNRGIHENELAGLAVLASDDIWAVGRYNSGRPPTVTGRDTLALHWNGAAWTGVPTPNPSWPGADYFTLEDVIGTSPTQVWAVGDAEDFASLKSTTLIERWNGSAWKIVPSPNPGGANLPNRLSAVATTTSQGTWAVGAAGFPEHSLSLRYRGWRWRNVPNACGAPLNGVDIVSADDVWAVGTNTTCHFDGSIWSIIASPQPRPQYAEIAYILTDVSSTSSTDVWASGYRVVEQNESYVDQSIVEHWDGTAWTLTTIVPGQSLNAVDALARSDVWAVGTDGIRGLVVHFDGTSWNVVPSPTPGDSGALADVAAESANHLWADGTSLGKTLVEESPSRFEGTVTGDIGVSGATVSWFGRESGSVQTDVGGSFAAAGLLAGTYTFVATNPGCAPAQARVTVVAGTTVSRDLPIHC